MLHRGCHVIGMPEIVELKLTEEGCDVTDILTVLFHQNLDTLS